MSGVFRFNMRPRYASRDAQPAGDLVRYLQREGEYTPQMMGQDRDVTYMTRTDETTREYDDLVGAPIVANLPAWANGDIGKYFLAASEFERVNGPYAMAFQLALPRSMTHDQHMALAQDFADAVMHDKPYLIVKHEPIRQGRGQPHLHILMGLRIVDGIERGAHQTFRRYNSEHPERGGAQKDRFWNQRQAPQQIRAAFSDLTNFHAERVRIDHRIDPRSLRKQGIDRERISWNNPQTLDAATLAREQAQAAAAWEQRKAHKGIEDIQAIPREEFVLLVRQWTRAYAVGAAVEKASDAEVSAWQAKERERRQEECRALEHELHGIETRLRLINRAQTSRTAGRTQGREEQAHGQGYRVRLHEEEDYERASGRGW